MNQDYSLLREQLGRNGWVYIQSALSFVVVAFPQDSFRTIILSYPDIQNKGEGEHIHGDYGPPCNWAAQFISSHHWISCYVRQSQVRKIMILWMQKQIGTNMMQEHVISFARSLVSHGSLINLSNDTSMDTSFAHVHEIILASNLLDATSWIQGANNCS